MAGIPPQSSQPMQPGQMPQQQVYYGPPPKKKGGTSSKVWGILLMVLSLLSVIGVASSLFSLTGGMTGTELSPGLTPEAKESIERMTAEMVNDMKGRWSFWANLFLELVIGVLSAVAGIFLAIKPKPLGRKLGIARAFVVIVLFIPVMAIETNAQMDQTLAMQQSAMREQVKSSTPSGNDAENESRQKRMDEDMQEMQPFIRGATYGIMVVMAVGILIINALLLFFMTRPTLKEYLEDAQNDVPDIIPGYDPSMGMMQPPPGAPPGQHPGNPPPPNAPRQ